MAFRKRQEVEPQNSVIQSHKSSIILRGRSCSQKCLPLSAIVFFSCHLMEAIINTSRMSSFSQTRLSFCTLRRGRCNSDHSQSSTLLSAHQASRVIKLYKDLPLIDLCPKPQENRHLNMFTADTHLQVCYQFHLSLILPLKQSKPDRFYWILFFSSFSGIIIFILY